MNEYLILKLQGPMQSWGGHTYEDYRPSESFPTRSAVIGLLAGCLGIDRTDKQDILKLADSIEMAVRKDEYKTPVSRLTDFHTVEKARKVDGKANKNPVVSRREYICDVSFTLAMRSTSFAQYALNEIKQAIHHPVFTPYLGRRSCPLTRPLFEKMVQAESFTDALSSIQPGQGIIYSDIDENSDGQLQLRDVPLNRHRQFATRRVYIHVQKGGSHVPE